MVHKWIWIDIEGDEFGGNNRDILGFGCLKGILENLGNILGV